MERVIAFIDGFNLYHSLIENSYNNLKWINYKTLAEAFIIRSKEKLEKVLYFTAFALWDREKVERHKIFIRALEYYGVETILGKFKRVTKTCRAVCKKQYTTYEEKETDINIAVRMLLEAVNDTFDKALLFSGDSDMIAGIKALKQLAPHKHIKVIVPFNRSSIDLIQNCHSSAKLKHNHLLKNQMPDRIELSPCSGKFLCKPQEWS